MILVSFFLLISQDPLLPDVFSARLSRIWQPLCQVLSADNWDDSYQLHLPFIEMESTDGTEETPLLPSTKNLDDDKVYKRFAVARKRGILAIVSLIGLIPRTYI